jgi:hypothetical protein
MFFKKVFFFSNVFHTSSVLPYDFCQFVSVSLFFKTKNTAAMRCFFWIDLWMIRDSHKKTFTLSPSILFNEGVGPLIFSIIVILGGAFLSLITLSLGIAFIENPLPLPHQIETGLVILLCGVLSFIGLFGGIKSLIRQIRGEKISKFKS